MGHDIGTPSPMIQVDDLVKVYPGETRAMRPILGTYSDEAAGIGGASLAEPPILG